MFLSHFFHMLQKSFRETILIESQMLLLDMQMMVVMVVVSRRK